MTFVRFLLLIALFAGTFTTAKAGTVYPAPDDAAAANRVVVYSSLDEELSRALIAAFQAANPDVTVVYEELQTLEIHERIIRETDANQKTADLAVSSAMDLQMKLTNDGYAQAVDLESANAWPKWANWRGTAYALTFEPAVIVYHKPSFAAAPPPQTRGELMRFLTETSDANFGRIGTYDIERAGLGFLFLARDQEHYRDIWRLVQAMGAANVKLYSNSSAILERIADGRFILGYNILGSYAASWAEHNADLGIVLPKDYTVVMSRIGIVPKAAAAPDLGARFLNFMMSRQGQTVLAEDAKIPALHPSVVSPNSAGAMRTELGSQLRPVPVSPGLLVYLDQVKRARLIRRWNDALRNQ